MKCKQCGTENKADAMFCSHCGYVFDNEEAIFSENEQTINAEASHKQSQIDEIKRRRDIKRKRKKIKKLILIALIILFCAGVIYGAFYMSAQNDIKFNDNKIEQAQSTPTPTPTETVMTTPTPTVMPTLEPTVSPEATEEAEPVTTVEATPTPKATVKATKAPTKATKAPAKSTPKPVSTPKPAPTPEPNPVLDSTVVVVVETINDNGASYVKALTSGKTVYLKSDTPIESSSYSMVSATDTGEKINNVPVYTVSAIKTVEKTEFILPDSSLRLLTQEDVSGLSLEQLKIARNEIYARHGRKFKDEALNSYFTAKAWYKLNPAYKYNNDELNVSDIENKNAHFLLDVERALQNQ